MSSSKKISVAKLDNCFVFHDAEHSRITTISILSIFVDGLAFDDINQQLVSGERPTKVLIETIDAEEARRVTREVFDLLNGEKSLELKQEDFEFNKHIEKLKQEDLEFNKRIENECIDEDVLDKNASSHPVRKRRLWPWALASFVVVAGLMVINSPEETSSSSRRLSSDDLSRKLMPHQVAPVTSSGTMATPSDPLTTQTLSSDPLTADVLKDEPSKPEGAGEEDGVVRFGVPNTAGDAPYVFRPKIVAPAIKIPELNCD